MTDSPKPQCVVDLPAGFCKCFATEHSHYSIANGLVQPGPEDNGHVYLVGTNGSVAAVILAKGKTNGEHLVPQEMFPKGNKTLRKAWLEGERWENNASKTAATPQGNFPKVCDVLPEIDQRGLTLYIDAQQLLRLASAISEPDRPYIALHLPEPTITGAFVKPIAARGSRGIGAIMPVDRDEGLRWPSYADARDKYKEAAK